MNRPKTFLGLVVVISLSNISQTTSFLSPPPSYFVNNLQPKQLHKHNLLYAESLTDSNEVQTEDLNSKVQVQRKYNTFQWTNPTSSQTHSINYKVEGSTSNPPILLIHGFGANVNHFRYNFPALVDAGYCVYAVDLLGFGGSDKPKDEEYCIEMWVDLLTTFIQHQSVENHNDKDTKWVVAGNSIGGLCSLGVAAELQSQIRGITLFNCAGGMTGFRYEELPFLLKPILYFIQKVVLAPDGYGGKFFADFKTRENVESILKNQGVYGDTKNVDEELLEILLGPSDDDGAKEVFLKVFGGPAGPTPESLLPQIDAPILALWGSDDPWTPVDKGLHPGNQMGNYAKGGFDLQVLDGAGHCPHDECPEEVHQKMLPWLEALNKM